MSSVWSMLSYLINEMWLNLFYTGFEMCLSNQELFGTI